MVIETASIDSIIIYFGDKIDDALLLNISFYYKSLKSLNNPNIVSIVPSYTSILIRYNSLKYSEEKFKKYIKGVLDSLKKKNLDKFDANLIKIPVFYDESIGFDLKRISKKNSISIDKIIEIHSKASYLVYAVGFMPGFAYLGKVDNKIATSRLSHPRDFVPKGSVGIADNQTAVYPKDSPGGWNIIGRTPINLFDPDNGVFSLFEIGDKVKFIPISKEEFLSQGGTL